jgi:predicted acetyltransferase
MAETYPIRTIDAAEFTALTDIPAQAFLDTWPPEAIDNERKVIEYDRTIAAFDGETMTGSASAHSFQLTVPGGSAAAAGVTFVSVLPTYRRRGILTGLMNRLLADASARGESLAILFASQAGIYGRFGFGMASQHQRVRFGQAEGKLTPGAETTRRGTTRVRGADPRDAAAELGRIFDAVLPDQPGMLARTGRWWEHILADVPAMRSGQSPLRCILAEDDAGPRGYALFRTKLDWGDDHIAAGSIFIRELFGLDPDATAALWTDLLTRDLVTEVVASIRPVDDPMLAMLADPRQARPSPADGLWLRLVDLPAALRRRRYCGPADVVIEVSDPMLEPNSGRWRLRTDGRDETGPASCERTDDPADLRMPVQALGAAYLGAPCFAQLAAAGHIAELTQGSLARLGTAMSWERAPYSPMLF